MEVLITFLHLRYGWAWIQIHDLTLQKRTLCLLSFQGGQKKAMKKTSENMYILKDLV